MDGGGEVMASDAYFILSSERDDHAKLLSYTGTVQRGKLVLTIKVLALPAPDRGQGE